MDKRRPSLIPELSDEDDKIAEKILPDVNRIVNTQLCQATIFKEVARRRTRLGTDIWKEVTRRDFRVTKSLA